MVDAGAGVEDADTNDDRVVVGGIEVGRVGRPVGRDAAGADGGPDVIRAAVAVPDVAAGVVLRLRVRGCNRARRDGGDGKHRGRGQPAGLANEGASPDRAGGRGDVHVTVPEQWFG